MVAATGVGAGDLVAAAVCGAQYGVVVLWVAALGAVIKFGLNEGVARWQLATGTTLLEGWIARLPIAVSIYFFIYLLLWSFIVAGALISACGLAAHALMPQLSVAVWGVMHSVVAIALVWLGRYGLLEHVMKFFIALMFGVILFCAMLLRPNFLALIQALSVPIVPAGSGKFLLGVIGGVGGSVTLLCYGYWIRAKGWQETAKHRQVIRVDLAVAYAFTGIFGIGIIIIAAGVNPEVISGNKIALVVAERLAFVSGAAGKWTFLLGFWGAVFSSMIGVWHGVPYLFADFVANFRRRHDPTLPHGELNIGLYRAYLLYLGLPPMLLLLFDRPVMVIVIYAITGAFFMPFLGGLLLWMNNRIGWVGEMKNGWRMNVLLVVALLLFCYLLITEIMEQLV